MTTRIPIIPTVIVAGAIAVMIALGFWQLSRMGDKEALIAQANEALQDSRSVAWPSPGEYEQSLYHRSSVNCLEVRGIDSRAGRSAKGASGWMHIARCTHEGGGVADVAIGWSKNPEAPDWSGGKVEGIIGPYGRVVKLIATEPHAGLEPLATPNPADLPNSHLAYAGQWFFFALTALAIYILALRRRAGGTRAKED